MRRKSIFWILLFSLLLTTVSSCQALTAFRLLIEPTPELSQKSPDIRGIIQDIYNQNEKVRGFDVKGKKEMDTTYDRAGVGITENTHIFIKQGNKYIKTTVSDLQVGQTVEVLFTGPVATSYPVQAVASEIVIVNTPLAFPLPSTIPVSPSYPYPGVITGHPPDPYPMPSVIQPAQPTIITPKPSATPYPSPMPVSADKLSTTMKNIGFFLDELPFASETVYAYREYYGCQDSLNAGITMYYNVINRTSGSIKSQYIEWFDNKNMMHGQWAEFPISGFSGNAWQFSAVYTPAISSMPQAALYVSFIEYEGRITPEQSNLGTPQYNVIPKAEIHLWFSYLETGEKVIIPERQRTILKTCKNGWWVAINP